MKRGGLKVPNVKLYYYASKLVWISDWVQKPFDRYLKLEKPKSKVGFHELLWPGKKQQ